MRTIVFVVVALALSGCGHGEGDIDELIGAACGRDSDCDERCYQGGDYPGGFCSLACNSDADCPLDAMCMDRDGGVCLFLCTEVNCSRLGPGWECRDRDRISGGKADVCSG